MDYRQFEKLVLLLGGATILAAGLATTTGQVGVADLAAQVMLFAVLFGAVHWGRRVGFVAAASASLVYITIYVTQAIAGQPVPFGNLVLLIARVLAFGIVGIVGGEACSRIKYAVSTLAGDSAIDEESGVYNQLYASRVLDAARGRLQRYDEPFSVVTVTLSESLWVELTEKRRRQFVRSVASYLRSDVRIVDEVARLGDGTFLVIMPHTPKLGGTIVAERAGAGMRRMLGASERAVRATCYGGVEDAAWMDTLLDLMQAAQSAVYKASGESTENPDSRSTSAAAGSSTFNTSTAAVAKGSTKQ